MRVGDNALCSSIWLSAPTAVLPLGGLCAFVAVTVFTAACADISAVSINW